MPIRNAILVLVASVGVVALSIYSAALLLQACALPVPFLEKLSGCKNSAKVLIENQLEIETARGTDLQRRVFELERELSELQCEMNLYDANAPLNQPGWNKNDLSMLYGCWSLDTTYRTRDIDTGNIRTYSDWRMCFDTKGNGKQFMQSDDGITCEGSVQANFGNGSLSFLEPGNLACSEGGYIHQRQISCAYQADGTASCDTLQPETRGSATVGFRR